MPPGALAGPPGALAGPPGAPAAGDVTALELAWDRLRDDSAASAEVTAELRHAREAADRKDVAAAEELAAGLGAAVAQMK